MSLPLFPFVRGEVLLATSSSPHLNVIHLPVCSTLLCLLSSSSSLPPLLLSSVLPSQPWPPSSPPALLTYITLPVSSVVCHPPSFLRVQPTVICSSPVSLSIAPLTHVSSLNSTILRLSALVTLAIFHTQLFSHTCSLYCCSSVIPKVSVP